MSHKPEVVSGLLGIFLRAVETTIPQRSPDAPVGSIGMVILMIWRFTRWIAPPTQVVETAGPSGVIMQLLTEAPAVLPARAPPQVEMDFDQVGDMQDWPDMDQRLRQRKGIEVMPKMVGMVSAFGHKRGRTRRLFFLSGVG